MIRVLVADDHALMREGLKQLFEYVDDIEVVAEATNGDAVLEMLKKGRYDLLLLDVTMPGLHGVELIEKVRAMPDSPPILMLSMHNESQIAKRKLRAGAAGYINKDSSPVELMKAIRKVASGGRYVSEDLADRILFEMGESISSLPHTLLTDRELPILKLLASGKRVSEIASELDISVKTVSTHKANIKQKMRLENDAQLTRYAIDHGLIK